MSDKDLLVVLGASYDSVDDAETDYEAVKAIYDEAGVGHAFDAAVLERGADGRSRSPTSTSSPRATAPGWASPSARSPRSFRGSDSAWAQRSVRASAP